MAVLVAGCSFGDNLTNRATPDGGGNNFPHDDAGVATDGSAVPSDAAEDGPPAACALVPQGGCSGATPACDVAPVDDGSVACRAVTKQGNSSSHCAVDTECRAGFTCIADEDPANASWCARMCATDGDCTGVGSRCVTPLTDGNGHDLGVDTCSNACKLVEQTGCPSGMGCVGHDDPAGNFTDCDYMGDAADGASCDAQADCTAGSVCVVLGNDAHGTCEPWCEVGDDTPCGEGTCTGFTTPFTLGTTELGACQ